MYSSLVAMELCIANTTRAWAEHVTTTREWRLPLDDGGFVVCGGNPNRRRPQENCPHIVRHYDRIHPDGGGACYMEERCADCHMKIPKGYDID